MTYKNKEDRNRSSLAYYYRNREKVLKYQKKRWKMKYKTDIKFREKRKIRDLSRRVNGINTKINAPCSKCGSLEDLQRHHHDYTNIEHIIVCRKCHNQIHFGSEEISQSM